LTISINTQTAWYLDQLIETGLFGNKRTDAVRTVLYDHCKLLIAEGKLGVAPSRPGGGAITVD